MLNFYASPIWASESGKPALGRPESP
jgi:hypothetical protein